MSLPPGKGSAAEATWAASRTWKYPGPPLICWGIPMAWKKAVHWRWESSIVTGVWMTFRKCPVIYIREAGSPATASQCRCSPLCLQPIQSVSFLRGGYVEVPPKSLSPESSLLATFTTKNSSGIILAALGKDSERAGWSQAHVVSSYEPWKEMPSSIMGGKFVTHRVAVAVHKQLCLKAFS